MDTIPGKRKTFLLFMEYEMFPGPHKAVGFAL